ncbi:MAG: cupin domain-containing protein [Ilumatobacteraceae bacterium]
MARLGLDTDGIVDAVRQSSTRTTDVRIVRADYTGDRALGRRPSPRSTGPPSGCTGPTNCTFWHVNDGDEVFVVLDGVLDMHVRDATGQHVHRLEIGDVFYADAGTEHVAHPVGPSRVLVVERAGSV